MPAAAPELMPFPFPVLVALAPAELAPVLLALAVLAVLALVMLELAVVVPVDWEIDEVLDVGFAVEALWFR